MVIEAKFGSEDWVVRWPVEALAHLDHQDPHHVIAALLTISDMQIYVATNHLLVHVRRSFLGSLFSRRTAVKLARRHFADSLE